MKTVCVGIDVGSSSCKLAVIDKETRKLLHRATVPTTAPALWAELRALRGHEVHVHLEASEMAEWVRFVCKPAVGRVTVSHPTDNLYIARDRKKHDERDALHLAEAAALEKYTPVYYTDDPVRAEFKRIVQLYDRVVKALTQRKNSIKTAFRRVGIIEKGTAVYSEEGRKAVLETLALSPMAGTATRTALEELYALMDSTETHRRRILQAIRPLAAQLREIKRFEEVPGIGFALACRFSAYVTDPKRFPNKRKLWQYCGLGISSRSSDDKPLGREALDPKCVRALKAMSRSAVLSACRCKEDNVIKRTFQAVLDRGGEATHARLTAQRKILALLRAMWIDGTNYRDEDMKKKD